MKKIICIMLALVLCLLTLAGCGCKHEWKEATCEDPKTCSECGETEGEALGHDWEDATCTAPKTCSECGETEGEALGHNWEDATCAAPKTCSECGEIEGEPLEHTWEDATTEAPMTCTECGATEGEPLSVDERFDTASTKALYGTWVCETTVTGEMMDLAGYVDYVDVSVSYQFNNDGTGVRSMNFKDKDAFIESLKSVTKAMVMEEFTAMGLTEADVEEMMQLYYGMSLDDYITSALETEGMMEMAEGVTEEFIYYVEGDTIYVNGDCDWDGDFDYSVFSIENDVLVIENEYLDDPSVPIEWVKTI